MNFELHSQIQFAPVEPLDDIPVGKCAWAFLVMLNDEYAAGVAVAAKSLRAMGTKYPIWCMIARGRGANTDTLGVTDACVEFLRGVCDNVVEVPLIEHECVKMPGKKQNNIYAKWINYSFTKLHILDPAVFPFDKVCFLDADCFAIENFDHVFNVTAPAATFSNPWITPYVEAHHRKEYKQRKKSIPNPYGEIAHGGDVTREMVRRGLESGTVGQGHMMLVAPSELYVDIRREMLSGADPYGYPGCYGGSDEQAFADIFMRASTSEIVAHHIHQTYNWLAGKASWLPAGARPRGAVQFYNDCNDGKPWRKCIADGSTFSDTRIWWFYAKGIITAENREIFYRTHPLYKYITGRVVPVGPEKVRFDKFTAELAALDESILAADIVGEGANWINSTKVHRPKKPTAGGGGNGGDSKRWNITSNGVDSGKWRRGPTQ
jgi:hypothetical protein